MYINIYRHFGYIVIKVLMSIMTIKTTNNKGKHDTNKKR
jgi:hypothetical protein